MKTRLKQLIVFTLPFIFLSINLVNCVPYSESSNATSFNITSLFSSADFWEKSIYTILGAVLTLIVTIISNYVNERRKLKFRVRKQLSYEISTKKDLVEVEKEIKDKVKVLYNNKIIENLYYVACDIENSGNTVIKNQYIRFEFPQDTKIIDPFFDPVPEPEIGLQEEKNPELNTYELKYKIGHLECGQQVGYRFILTSENPVVAPKLHPFNEEGDVTLVSKSRSKSYEEKNDIVNFITLYLYMLILPSAFLIFGSAGDFAANLIRLIILIYIYPFIKPFAKVVGELISGTNDRKTRINSEISISEINVGDSASSNVIIETRTK
jgi:hypothetical protein